MIGVLCHDTGYVKGVCRNDTGNHFATGVGDELVYISPEGTDVALWHNVRPYNQDALKHPRMTEDGKQWIANVHSHVFDAEHPSVSAR